MAEKVYKPKFEQKEILTEPIEISPSIDMTSKFDFPFDIKLLPRLLSYSKKTQVLKNLATRTVSEGRAFSYPPVAFRNNENGIVYFDLSVKGGGSEVKPNVVLIEMIGIDEIDGKPVYDGESPLEPEIIVKGKKFIIRYHTNKLLGFTSLLGAHDYNSGVRDMYMTKFLEERGLRTRSMVAMWELPPTVQMSTPNGVISNQEFKEKTKTTPGLEIWAMRCKYRVHDILRYVYEMENLGIENEPSALYKLHFSKVDFARWDNHEQSHKFLESRYDPKDRLEIVRTFVALANEIKGRAVLDNDNRFSELAQLFPKEITKANLEAFYVSYLSRFAEVLGDQFAVLRNSNALSGMFNFQNISLLAEIVDHDVTMVDNKQYNPLGQLINTPSENLNLYQIDSSKNDLNFYNQLYMGYNSVRQLLRILGRTGIINITDNQMRGILHTFLSAYMKSAQIGNDEVLNNARRHIEIVRKQLKDPSNLDYFGKDGHFAFAEDVIKVYDK